MDLLSRTVGELVAEDYRKAIVFKKFGIDFCCGGGRTVENACMKKGVPAEVLVTELHRIEEPNVEPTGARTPTGIVPMMEYITTTYHSYFRSDLPIVREFLQKVARVHGNGNPEVIPISNLFDQIVDDLLALVELQENDTHDSQTSEGRLERKNPFALRSQVELTCAKINGLMSQISDLSSTFTPPDHACTTYRVAYAKLAEFQETFVRYVLLEDRFFAVSAGK